MSLSIFVNGLARNMTKRLAKAVHDNNAIEVRKIKKALENPEKLHDDVKKLHEKYKNGETLEDVNREIDETLIDGPTVVQRLKKLGTHDPENENPETSGFKPKTLRDIQEHNTFKKEVVDIDHLISESPELKGYVDKPDVPNNRNIASFGDPIDPIQPIVDKNGSVRDGLNRLKQVKLDKDNKVGDGKVTILRGTSVLKDNADGEVIKRISMFANNLRSKIDADFKTKKDDQGILLKKGTVNKASMKDMKFALPVTSFARILQKATKNNKELATDDEMLVGFAVDVLRAAKNNKGGRPGKKLTEIAEDGSVRVTTAKNMNELAKEIGEAAMIRLLSNSGATVSPDEQRIFGRYLLEFGRGNFGGDVGDSAIRLPNDSSELKGYHLLKTNDDIVQAGKSDVRESVSVTTSDQFDFWAKGGGLKNVAGEYESGHGGNSFLDLFPETRSVKSWAIKHHGNWVVDEYGNVVKGPAGIDITQMIGGGKGLTSETINSAEVLNILGNRKIGIDPVKFEYWQHLGERGLLDDTGMDSEALNAAVKKHKLSTEQENILFSYYEKLKNLKSEFNERENKARREAGKPELTGIQMQNFGIGKHLRTELKDLYYKKGKGKNPPTGEKVDLDNSVGSYTADNDNFLKALQMVSGDVKTIPLLNVSRRSRFKKIRREIKSRFRMDPVSKMSNGAEGYLPYMIDSRGRVYPVDSSGANLLTGGSQRFMHSAPKSLAKPIAYNDEAFHSLVDDFLRFEENPFSGSIDDLGKGKSSDLERWKYWSLNKDKYLKRGGDLLKASEDSISAKNKKQRDKIWDNWKKSNPWLKKIKDQGPYLSNLIEIAKIKKAYDKGEVYNTTQLIELDASASGSQHISAQYGDVRTLWSTNVYSQKYGKAKQFLTQEEKQMLLEGVSPDAAARDLYTDVQVFYKKTFEKELNSLKDTDPKLAAIYQELTDKYIQVGRSTTKPIVMKVPYGAGMLRLRKSLESLLKGKDRLEIMENYKNVVDDSTTLHQKFMDFHWKAMKNALEDGLDTQYEFRRFNSVVAKIYQESAGTLGGASRKPYVINAPTGGKTDLTSYASQQYRTYEWIENKYLPNYTQEGQVIKDKGVVRIQKTGPEAGQPAKRNPRTKVNTDSLISISVDDPRAREIVASTPEKELQKRGITYEDLDEFAIKGLLPQESPFIGKGAKTMGTSLAPNVTHQVDAGYLNQLVIKLDEAGIPVYVVHDAFFVLPTDVKKTKEIAGQVFIDMHNNYNLREEMIKGLAKSLDISYKDALDKVNDKMMNPTELELIRGILPYPEGALRRKSKGELGSPENLMSYQPEGVNISSPDEVTTSNVIIGG